MLSIQESQQLMEKLLKLRQQAKDTKAKNDVTAYDRQLATCIASFQYLIRMRTGKYKSFSNYEDLNQEGQEALLKAMKTYNPSKGKWFSWAHYYIATRISRSANRHTVIHYPLKFAKETTPHKEAVMPVQIEELNCPNIAIETEQIAAAVQETLTCLSDDHAQIIRLHYGLNGGEPMSINKLCQTFKLSRAACLKIVNDALEAMREDIKL